jgi:hypothetical protein
MVRAESIAAISTTRKKRGERSLSMFSPKLLAFFSVGDLVMILS